MVVGRGERWLGLGGGGCGWWLVVGVVAMGSRGGTLSGTPLWDPSLDATPNPARGAHAGKDKASLAKKTKLRYHFVFTLITGK